MAEGPVITFAIPFFKNKDYLRRTIDSVRAQGRGDWLCLVVDDHGPEPDARQLVDSYGDARLSYVRAEHNAGLAGNWNRCLDLARTPLVTLLHSDDELLPNYTDLMVEAARRHPQAAAFFCECRIIDAAGQEVFSFPDHVKSWIKPRRAGDLVLSGDEGLAAVLRGNFIMCPTLCYRPSVISTRRFNPRWRMVVDLDYIAALLLDGVSLVGLAERAYSYRRHDANQTSLLNADRSRFLEECAIYGELSQRALALGWREAARVGRQRTIIKLHLGYQALRHLLGLRPGEAARDLRLLLALVQGKDPSLPARGLSR